MQNNIKLTIVLLFIICFALFANGNADAQNIQEISPETLAVTLVIDMSDSMNQTDPEKLRETAANIFIDMLSPEDYLGIIVFNDNCITVQELQKISNTDNKTAIKRKLSPYIMAAGWTDYKLALDNAYSQLLGLNDANARKMVIFLTDGAPSFPSEGVPGAMDAYLQSLWGTVNNYAVHKIPIYSLGFSDNIKKEILQRISSDTSGDFKVLGDKSLLAKSFYETLGKLKNRENMIDTTLTLTPSTGVDFSLDEYASQATIVVVNKGSASYEVQLTDPSGKAANNSASINKTDKYTIITINNSDTSKYGKWHLAVKGSGTVDIYGNIDMTFKSWVVSPDNLSVHPLNEPLQLEVMVTGSFQSGISITAYVESPLASDSEEIQLVKEGNSYKGEFLKTANQGEYKITVKVFLDGEEITTSTQTIKVRQVPVLVCDFYPKQEGYRVGEKAGLTSSLNQRGIRLLQGNSLKITNYSLLISKKDGSSEVIALMDNGKSENNDILADDGLWSCWINFDKETDAELSIIVTGTYNNENFVIEKSIGTCHILEPGKITITYSGSNIIGAEKKTVKVPVIFENVSPFAEIISVSIDPAIGTIKDNKISLEPNSKSTKNIDITINNELAKGEYDVTFRYTAENAMTKIINDQYIKKIEIVSQLKYTFRHLSDFYSSYYEIITFAFLLPVVGVSIILLIYLVGGSVLYKTVFLKRGEISGILHYDLRTIKPDTEMKNKIDLGIKGKRKLILHIGRSQDDYDFIIRNTVYNYDLVFSSLQERKRSICTTGWLSILKRGEYISYKVTAKPPGIIENNNEILSSIIIKDGDSFISGDYVFRYYVDPSRYTNSKKTGRDLLLGK